MVELWALKVERYRYSKIRSCHLKHEAYQPQRLLIPKVTRVVNVESLRYFENYQIRKRCEQALEMYMYLVLILLFCCLCQMSSHPMFCWIIAVL